MIATLGSTPKVRCFPSAQAAALNQDFTDRRVNVISEGPPGTVGCWGFADGQYWLVRKMPEARKGGGVPDFYAIEGDRGEK